MSTTHTPEPWFVSIDVGISKQADSSADIIRTDEGWLVENLADLDRIVTCVNACKGISNEALEAGVLGEMLEALKEYLEAISWSWKEADAGHHQLDKEEDRLSRKVENFQEKARAILAKLEGKNDEK